MTERIRISPIPCHVPFCKTPTLNADGYCSEDCRSVARQAREFLDKDLITTTNTEYNIEVKARAFPEPDPEPTHD